MTTSVEVLATGPLTTLQDHGRAGHLALGVSPSGAADRASHALGQRLLGNPPGSPSLEATFGGLSIRARGDLLVCLTGAPVRATLDGRHVPMAAPFPLRDKGILTLAVPSAGVRTYLSVRGGWVGEEVLGSCSTDTLSGLGPPPLRPGMVLDVGPEPLTLPHVDHAPVPVPTSPSDVVTLTVTTGPRAHWFEQIQLDGLTRHGWIVSERSDRKGIRLLPPQDSPGLRRRPEWQGVELPSEGMVPGAIQVPHGGEPVLLLRDHPVTGGYPVIAVLSESDLDRAGQLPPGQQVRFTARFAG